MNKDDVKNLANLARISIDDKEIANYQKDFDSILNYVDSIQKIKVSDLEPEYFNKNVMREDDETNKSGENTNKLIKEAPDKKNGYYKVQKIL